MVVLKKKKITGEESGEVSFKDEALQKKERPFEVQQVVRAFLASQHRGTHKTKTRSEVKGSRRKLFKQKGTGNARAGDAKSPLRRHGGVAFGPVVRSYDLKVNKKVRKIALSSVLAQYIREKKMHVLDSLEFNIPKTKEVSKLMKTMELDKALFVSHDFSLNFELACRNLPNAKCILDSSLGVYEILKFSNLVITERALKNIESRLLV
eukprot:TRINITY_DN5367_c1_g1_i2.p1 TRINITY_DN5367_c1_g1~~TRINITY_DN5367_c1_g1_i2.p1  ORF type:complete len:208 (-),score=9.00 TRINITY_DN5367_c1_g1_i2:58-681(-)